MNQLYFNSFECGHRINQNKFIAGIGKQHKLKQVSAEAIKAGWHQRISVVIQRPEQEVIHCIK